MAVEGKILRSNHNSAEEILSITWLEKREIHHGWRTFRSCKAKLCRPLPWWIDLSV